MSALHMPDELVGLAAALRASLVRCTAANVTRTRPSTNPDSVVARILFIRGLDNEGLLTEALRARLADTDIALPDDDHAPLLLAISDNGTEVVRRLVRAMRAAVGNRQ